MTVAIHKWEFAVVLAGVMSVTAAASGQNSPDHPTKAEREQFLSELPPLPRSAGPAPLAEADEHARRPWEIVPRVGVGTSVCYGSAGTLCAAEGEGLSLGVAVLWRMTPHIGAGLLYTRFGGHVDPAGLSPSSNATVASDFMGIAARGYFLDRGAFDPYVQAGFGRGSYRLDISGGGADGSITAAAPATSVAAGLDVWLGSFAKVGPSVEYVWTWFGDVRTCDAFRGCSLAAAGDLGVPTTHLVLGLSLTAAFGRAM